MQKNLFMNKMEAYMETVFLFEDKMTKLLTKSLISKEVHDLQGKEVE